MRQQNFTESITFRLTKTARKQVIDQAKAQGTTITEVMRNVVSESFWPRGQEASNQANASTS